MSTALTRFIDSSSTRRVVTHARVAYIHAFVRVLRAALGVSRLNLDRSLTVSGPRAVVEKTALRNLVSGRLRRTTRNRRISRVTRMFLFLFPSFSPQDSIIARGDFIARNLVHRSNRECTGFMPARVYENVSQRVPQRFPQRRFHIWRSTK